MERILEESRESVTCPICTDVFDDPRTLTCSHSFCLHCLVEFRQRTHTNQFCPICRKLTVPSVEQMVTLPKNEFASNVVKLIKETEQPRESRPVPLDEGDRTDGEAMFVGDLIKEPPDETNGKAFGAGVSILAGVAVTAITGGLFGAVAGLAVFAIGTLSSIEAERKKKHRYDCHGCGSVRTSMLRYRCGKCAEFILCPSCFEDSISGSNVHSAQHLFLKLKSPPKRQLPADGVFKPKIDDMVQTINHKLSHDGTVSHGRAYVHSPQRLVILPAIQCNHCGAMPISGVRYKCGMCSDYDLCSKCELDSEKIHGEEHVFIVLKHHSDVNIISEPLVTAKFY